MLEYKGNYLSGRSYSSSPEPRTSGKSGSGGAIISEMARMDDKRTKECTEALAAVHLSGFVIEIKLNDRKNERGKEIKGLEVTTRSEEEVLPDKENTRKVVSMTNRRIKFIETSIPGNVPASNENAPGRSKAMAGTAS
jgi:hypothetical protein